MIMRSAIEPGNLVLGVCKYPKNSIDDNCTIHIPTVLEVFAYP